MAKKSSYAEGASPRDKKVFAAYLAEDEELVLVTGYGKNYLKHKFAYYMILPGGLFWFLGLAGAYFYQVNLGYGLLGGMAASMVLAYIKTVFDYHAHRYLLTTRRVLIKKGFLSVKLISALYDKVTHIEVDQSFLDRLIMKHGNVIISTAGMNKLEMRIDFIDDPIEFKNLLERLINREREQLGKSTGTVVAVEGEVVE